MEGPPLVAHLLPDRSEGRSMCPPPACLLVAGPAAAPDPKADTKRTNTTVS